LRLKGQVKTESMPPKKSIKTPSLDDLDETEDCSSKDEGVLRSKSVKKDVKTVSKPKSSKESILKSNYVGDIKFFVIGDTHFRLRFLKEGNEFINACVSQVRKCKPDFIVCLGDTLDTHADVNVLVYNVAYDFFKQLGSIAPVYVLIGNHDLINGSQCLTTNHIFNALKDLRAKK
jgi:predicted MPP superfamily phosphohydrolase